MHLDLPRSLLEKLSLTKLLVLDFDGVLTDNRVWVTEDGKESVACWRGDGLGIRSVSELGIHVWILSTETNPVVTARANKLRIPVIQACENKAAKLLELVQSLSVPLDLVTYLGNDINDTECLKLVGIPLVVCDAHQAVWEYALHRTALAGGRGAVREVCDMICAAKTWIPISTMEPSRPSEFG